MAGTTVTIRAKKKMLQARAGIISRLPHITQMAFGDGGVDSSGNVIDHSASANALNHELLRKAIDGYEVVSDTCIRYSTTLSESELANVYISECGLIDSDGDFVALKSFLKKGKDADMQVVFECEDTF